MNEAVSENDAFRGALALLAKHWRVILAFAATGLFAGAAGYFAVPRSYSAEAIVLPTESDGGSGLLQGAAGRLGELAGVAGLGLDTGGFRSEGMALLSSGEFIRDFVRDENLLPLLFYDDFDATTGQWKVPENERPTLNDAVRLFGKTVMTVDEDVDLGTISIRVDWRDPKLAATWANAVALRLNARIRERVIREAEQGRRHLEEELKQASLVELRSTIAGLIEGRLNTEAMARSRPDYAFRIVANAVARDSDDFDSPSLGLYLVAGPMLGVILGLLAAALLEWRPHIMQVLRQEEFARKGR